MKHLLFHFLASSLSAQTPITFPKDGGVLDVREFGAKANDDVDDTAAIQKALDAHPNGNRIVNLPEGTWVVTDTLRWPKGEGGNGEKRTILQGAGMTFTKLVVPPATPGFSDTAKAVLWTGVRPAQRFRNAVRDLTIEIGAGNPQAVGMQFNASNQGCVRNVSLRAAKHSGLIGLDMGFTDEIGPLLVRNLTVEGFETGIVTKWPVNSNTFEHVTLRGQRKLGWHNYHQMIFVRGLTSENAVTSIYNERDSWGTVTLLESVIRGQNSEKPGILNQRQMYLREVEVTGHAVAVDHADKGRDKGDVTAAGLIAEDTSHANVVSPFRFEGEKTFTEGKAVWRLVDTANDAPAVIIERMNNRSGGQGSEIRHESKRTLIVSSVIGFNVEGYGAGDIFLDDFCDRLNLNTKDQSACQDFSRFLASRAARRSVPTFPAAMSQKGAMTNAVANPSPDPNMTVRSILRWSEIL